MKKFLSLMLGVTVLMGSAVCVLSANEPEKHDTKKEEPHKGDHKPDDHKGDHKPDHK